VAFTESLKKRVRLKAHFRCCLCQAVLVEIHHIIPQAEGGSDEEDNAAPLCGSCHEIFGANPTKRKFIVEARDAWYDICAKRYAPDSNAIADIIEAVLREQLAKLLPQLASESIHRPADGDAAFADLVEDTRRWLKDRDVLLQRQSHATSTDRNARGLLYSGGHIAALAGLKRDTLHEYRDEISLKRRQYRHLRAEWPSVGRYELTDSDRDILARWRTPASHPAVPDFMVEIDDVTSEDREPDLRRFEREGDPPQ
jgi:hypothetical protein